MKKDVLNIYYSSGGYIKFQFKCHLMQATFTTKGLEITNEQTGKEFFVKEEFLNLVTHAAEQLIESERILKIEEEKGP